MKHLKHPATIIAAVALFVAFGGGAAAYASGLISGSKIKNHSIATKKLTKKAIKQLHGARGKTGPAGPAGPAGAPGATGPQGPGGSILTYDATAKASPTFTTIGTLLGVTYAAECGTTGGDADLILAIKTTDGSWSVDTGVTFDQGGTGGGDAFEFAQPAGTFTNSTPLAEAFANSGGDETDYAYNMTQIKPVTGTEIWHLAATTFTSSPSCHASLEAIPETLTAVAGTPHATVHSSSRNPFGLQRH
jgi:hypothetical protein